MKYIMCLVVILFYESADADWIICDPPTYSSYDRAKATTTYYKGGLTWKTYNVPEHMRRGVIGTFDFLYNGATSPFRNPVYAPTYYYRPLYFHPTYTVRPYRRVQPNRQ